MKKIFFLLIASGALSATAQMRDTMLPVPAFKYYADSLLPRWVLDVNVLGGGLSQTYTTANSTGNYLNGVNMNQGNLSFSNGGSIGFDGQIGVFFGKKKHWGIGTGFMYLSQTGDATLNNFHAEYESVDANGNIYRQVVTPDQPIKEQLRITNMNIPLLLKYKNRLSERWGFTADAGLLFNVQMKNAYNTNATFDYEAIYQYTTPPAGLPTVYDNSPTPATTDFLITKSAYLATDNGGNVQNYFNQQRSLGYGVGLNVKPNSHTGTVSNTTGSVGLLLQPSLNYFLSDNVALNFGLYYIYQAPANNQSSGYTLTKNIGDYSSVLNNVTKAQDQSYGINIGVRIFLGKKHTPLVITSEDAVDPTGCGLSDGIIVLHGLTPSKDVNVNYSVNGSPHNFNGTVAANGTVKLTSLGAGAYSDIAVSSGKDKAAGIPVSLINPPLNIASEFSSNPSGHGVCDGSITLAGLRAGESATVDYDFNGVPQPQYSATVSNDKTIIVPHLCAGRYSHIVVTINNCTANGTDVSLQEPVSVAGMIEDTANIISNPIYFEVNKTIVHVNSYPTLKYAAKKLNEEKDTYIVVNGYTDNTGTRPKNMRLSVARAESVKSELVRMGVSPDRIKVIGNGPADPVGDNKTMEGKMQNRRAVMKLDVGDYKPQKVKMYKRR